MEILLKWLSPPQRLNGNDAVSMLTSNDSSTEVMEMVPRAWMRSL